MPKTSTALKLCKSDHPISGRIFFFMFITVLGMACMQASAAEKTRICILTDIENEPDDAMSMVRFLTYANQFDVEGLIALQITPNMRSISGYIRRGEMDFYLLRPVSSQFAVNRARSRTRLHRRESIPAKAPRPIGNQRRVGRAGDRIFVDTSPRGEEPRYEIVLR